MIVIAIALIGGGCSGTDAAPTTVPQTGTTSSSDFGLVSTFLDSIAPSLGVDPGFGGTRARTTPEFESGYVDAFRDGAGVSGFDEDLTWLTDDQLLYIGYLYCVGLDFAAPPEEAAGVVAATLANARGGVVDDPTTSDLAIAVAAAKFAAASICGDHFDTTEQFLARITSPTGG